jgi:ATP-binding cassette, subfamily B, multidrug efflux pump
MSKLIKIIKPYMFAILVGVFLTFVQSMLNLYLPNLMSDIVNKGVVGQNIDDVYKYGKDMLIITLISMFCSVIATYIAARVSTGYAKDIRNKVYKKVEKFSLNEFNKISTSSLITRTTNDVTQIQTLVLMAMRMMIVAPIMCVGGIIMATSKNLQLSILFLVIIPILLIIIGILAKRIVPLFSNLQKLTDKLNQVVREKLIGVRVIRAFCTEEYEKERFENANTNIYNTSLKAAYIMSYLMPIVMFIINASTVAIVWFGSNLIGEGVLQIGDMMAFMQYAMQVLFSILMVTMIFVLIPRAIVSGKRINEVLDLEITVKDNGKNIDLKDIPRRGEIEFNNVSFRYNIESDDVLSDVNFKVNKGETIAIIGGTGSGKTTLLNLMLRFYDNTKGEIKIGGIKIQDISLNSLRSMIGFVPQKVNLFSGTISDNIKYGKQGATQDEIENASKIAQAYDFIDKLDNKFDSIVSQGGTNYSGGQKQRISIARALIKKADICLFDDSFSALDYTTDSKLRKAIKENLDGNYYNYSCSKN